MQPVYVCMYCMCGSMRTCFHLQSYSFYRAICFLNAVRYKPDDFFLLMCFLKIPFQIMTVGFTINIDVFCFILPGLSVERLVSSLILIGISNFMVHR